MVMVYLKRRVEKAGEKVRSMEEEANDKKAKLLEIQKQGKNNSLKALPLQLELKHGRKFTFADLLAMLQERKSTTVCRI